MIPTGWLIIAMVVLPAVWGWLCAAAMRRLWPGETKPTTRSGPAVGQSGGGAVDFQI